MRCPRCAAESRVLETRDFEHGQVIRGRVCDNGHRFKTVEVYREVYGSARQRARGHAKSMAWWRELWQRNLDMYRNSHLGAQHFMQKYGVSRSTVFMAANAMRKHFRKTKR